MGEAAEQMEQPAPGPTLPRTTYLGGSDIAAVAGVHPYKTPLDVWAEKTGRHVTEETPRMRAGTVLERPILEELYAEPRGIELVYPGSVRSDEHAWAAVSPDALARTYDGAERVEAAGYDVTHGVECKLVGRGQWHRWGDEHEGPDGIPAEVTCQVQWAMALLLQVPRWHVVALMGSELRVFQIPRDDELIADLLAIGERFWREHVEADVMPEPTGAPSERSVLDAHYARVRKGLVDLADQTKIPELARAYDAAKRRVDEAKREQDRIANLLRAELGEHEGANFGGGRVLWSERKGSVDWRRAAIDAGVTEDEAEKYRRQPSRALRVTVKGED